MSMIKKFQQVIFTVSLLWLSSSPLYSQDLTDAVEADSSQFLKWEYETAEMGFYLPPATVENPPIVMYLHYCTGYPVSKNFWIVPAINAIEPTAVFLPTAPAEVNTEYPCADWGGTYDPSIRANMVNALHELDRLIEEHGLDSSRIYLYGESMGGEGVYRLLMDFPNRFAGAVVVGGYTLDKGGSKMAQTPLWIFHGSDDQISDVNNARTIYESIQDYGGTQVKYTELEGFDHTPSINQVHEEEGVLEWLLANVRLPSSIQNASLPSFNPSADLVRLKNNSLQFSPLVQSGSEFSLYNTSGVLLYKGLVKNRSVEIPVEGQNQLLVWNLKYLNQSSTGVLSSIN